MIPKDVFPTAERRTPRKFEKEVYPEKISKKWTAGLKNLCVLLNSFQITQVKFRLAYPS